MVALTDLYGKRMTIEEVFRDYQNKRNGFSLRHCVLVPTLCVGTRLRLLVFLQESFEQDEVFFLVAQERDAHLLRHVVIAFGGLNAPCGPVFGPRRPVVMKKFIVW